MDTRLEVDLHQGGGVVHVGTAHFSRRGRMLTTTFTYSPTYLARPDAFAIDPALPLDAGRGHTTGLPGAFADSAPDRWGRRLIEKVWRSAASISEVDYLVEVSDRSRQGALRFRRPDTDTYLATGHQIPRLIDLPRLLNAADRLTRRDQEAGQLEAVRELLDVGGTTLGGARPKASVLDGDGNLSIAKFPHPGDDWDVMAWEKTALDLAERAGIEVPARSLIKIDARSVLILRRFDRAADGARRGYISAMTMTELTDGDAADYLDVAAAIADHSARPDADLLDLWRRIAFFIAFRNTDDHLRNHGFTRTARGWVLAPAFDINPDPDPRRTRSTAISGARDRNDERDALINAAPYFGMSRDDAAAAIAAIREAVATWPEVAARNGLPHHEIRLFSDSLTPPTGAG